MFDFARNQGPPLARVVQDAPQAMRMQLIAALYRAAEEPVATFEGRRINVAAELYPKIAFTLGERPVAVMHDAYMQRIGRDLERAEWTLVFEVVLALWEDFRQHGRAEAYRSAVNGVFALNGIAWDLGEDGLLHRVLPEGAQAQVAAMFAELARPGFEGARRLAEAAQRHYDARPREDRDACSNIFDALEETAKVKLGLHRRGFGDVVAEMRRRNITPGLADVLDKLNGMAHQTFRHGNDVVIAPAVVDFVYLTCVGGILMFARLPV